jgi:hypothetical protein
VDGVDVTSEQSAERVGVVRRASDEHRVVEVVVRRGARRITCMAVRASGRRVQDARSSSAEGSTRSR